MACTVFLLVVLFSPLSLCHAQLGFTAVNCSPKHTGVVGQQSMLECVVTFKNEVESPEIKEVKWIKRDGNRVVMHFKGKPLDPLQRHRFAEPSWNAKNMNVSLLISNTEVADEGNYDCWVVVESKGRNSGSTRLNVTAKYNAPTIHSNPENIAPNTNSVLICQTEGGYPKGTLQWFDEQKGNWTGSAKMEAKRLDNGLFNLTSRLSLLAGSTFSMYTCAVYNERLDKEQEVTFVMPITPEGIGAPQQASQLSGVIAPVVIIGSLIVGLLIVLVFCKKCSLRRHNTSNEETVEAGGLMEGRMDENTNGTS